MYWNQVPLKVALGSIHCPEICIGSVLVSEWLELQASDHDDLSLNPIGGTCL